MAEFKQWSLQGSRRFSLVELAILFGASAIALSSPQRAIAQSITSAPDSTDTRVNRDGNRYDIDGGVRSRGGANLFHDFERFGLSRDEIANFLSNPDIRNILARVSGGEASFIDGLIQVSGGESNLFLMNPAGIIFGTNARLDVAADFMATTATGIGFAEGWFNATGDNDYASLVGTPSRFAFATDQPGSLVNAGTLSVAAGQNLSLLVGTVINTGVLSAPSGTITVSAVPGESLVRISQEGHLLNLEIAAPDGTEGQLPFTPLELPTLLTGSEFISATGVEVNPDGSVRLTGSNGSALLEPGTTLVSGTVDASAVDALAAGSMPQIAVTDDRVALLNATLDASSATGGGTIRVGGDYQGSGTLPNAQYTYVDAASSLTANGVSSASLNNLPADGGRIIVWAEGTTVFHGNVAARGGDLGGDGGFAEISGHDHLMFRGTADLSASNGASGTLLLDPENIIISGAAIDDPVDVGDALPDIFQNDFPGNDITLTTATLEINGNNTNLLLEATNDIRVESLPERDVDFGPDEVTQPVLFLLGAGDIQFRADSDGSGEGSFITDPTHWIVAPGRNIGISGVDIDVGTIVASNNNAASGSIVLDAIGNITATQLDTTVTAANGEEFRADAGSITLDAIGRIEISNRLRAWSQIGRGGLVDIEAGESVQISDIEAFTEGELDFNDGISSHIIIRSDQDIDLSSGDLNSSNLNIAADIILEAPGVIDTRNSTLNSAAILGSGGSIRIGSPGVISREALLGEIITQSNNEIAGNVEVFATNISLSGNINALGGSAGGSITLNGDVSLLNDISINEIDNELVDATEVGSIVFSGSVNGNRSLTLNAGDIDFQSTVDVSELDIAAEDVDFQDAVSVGELDIDVTNLVNFEGAVNSDRTLNITAGDVNFQGTVNVGELTITSNTTEVDSNISTNDNINLNSQVILNNSVAIEAQNSTIALNNGLNAGTHNLRLRAEELVLQGDIVGNGSRLILHPFDPSQSISLGSEDFNTNSFDLSQNELDTLSGFSRVRIGRANGTGGITIADDIELNVPTRLDPGEGAIALNHSITTPGTDLILGTTLLGDDVRIQTNDGILRFRGTVDGTYNFTVNAGAGNINFREEVGDSDPLDDVRIRNTGVLRIQDGVALHGTLTQRGAERARLAGTVQIGEGDLVWRSPLILIDDTSLISASGDIQVNARIRRAVNADLDEGLRLEASSGNIRTRNIRLAGDNISLISDAEIGVIRTGNLNSSNDAGGGDIEVQAGLSITTGNINSSAIDGDAGDVFLDPENDIQVGFINAESDNGRGGDVTAITQQFFRATNTFTALDGTDASISAIGGAQGGDITITHDGGARLVFFNVGALNLSNNGVVGAIATGTPDDVNLIAPLQGFLGPYAQLDGAGDIRIITTPQPVPETDDREETPSHIEANGPLDDLEIDGEVFELEAYFTEQFEDYLDLPETRIRSFSEIRSILQRIEQETGERPAIIYATFTPENLDISERLQPIPVRITMQNNDILHLIMVFANGEEPVQALVPELTRGQVPDAVDAFLTDGIFAIAGPDAALERRYLSQAQQFYQWLINPLRQTIEENGITNLVFVLDEGLRSVPLAALHDKEDYIITEYSLGLMPSVSLTDTRYTNPRQADVLAMGISDFSRVNLRSLPAVPFELQNISRVGWESVVLQNDEATIANLIATRQQRPFGIIHLATHAVFNGDRPENSYIQFWQESLSLNEVRNLGLDSTIVNLMVLSACQTALGNYEAELGFAGFAAQASVRSVLATLWQVNDTGTMVLMDEFYRQLQHGTSTIKAEALRQAQLALLRGDIRLDSNGQLVDARTGEILVSPEIMRAVLIPSADLSHPYIWSGFTIVGSPW